MKSPNSFCWLLLAWFPGCFANGVAEASKPVARVAVSANVLNWSLGLLIVLGVFFLCVWGLRKLNGLSVTNAEQMRIVGGLSLGMREKIILIQVGKKQLIVGVTPGRIHTLHVLEDDECLVKQPPVEPGSLFAQRLMQAMKGKSDV
jgi:flagellar protein FliO/FliZ